MGIDYNKPIGRNTSALFLLGLTIVSAIIFYVANTSRGFADAEQTNAETLWYGARLETSMGPIDIAFIPGLATTTINNFINLAGSDFYNGTKFHRVIPDTLIQGGDPLSRGSDRNLYGTGGPQFHYKDEINGTPMVRGVVAIAHSAPNKNGSQFFIVAASELPSLFGRYTIFARVTLGMDVVDSISAAPADNNQIPLQPVTLDDIVLH